MWLKTKHLVRALTVMLLLAVAFPENAHSEFLSESFLKEFSKKMSLLAHRRYMSLVLETKRKEKEFDALKQRQQDGEKIYPGKLYDLSCDCVRLKTELAQAKADIEFWESKIESYHGTEEVESVRKNSGSRSPGVEDKHISDVEIITKEQTKSCPICNGSGRCLLCMGSGWVSISLNMICPSCIGGVCSTCGGTGKVQIITTYDPQTKYWTAMSSTGVAVNGVSGSSVYGPANPSEPSLTSTDYQHDYDWWARHAESIYNSITREVNLNGDRKSDASGWGYSSSYSGMAGEYVRAQSEMRRIRANALKEKVFIQASTWETKQIRY